VSVAVDRPTLDPAVRAEAARRLDAIVREEGVRIVAAVESGSRAWGFPSPDSDYDVRFVYVRTPDDYLRLHPLRDVIERPIEGLWDVNGWDLRKALTLLCRGNAVVVEWLRSPLVYREERWVADGMRAMADRFGDADSAVRHYFGLLNGAWSREFAGRESVRLKKYFYVLRAAAALAWTRARAETPPMALPELIAGGALPAALEPIVEPLLAAKRAASELGEGPRVAELDAFIEDQLAWARERLATLGGLRRPGLAEAANELFRRAVLEATGA
jgi:predicted nucleotidyltransferase